MRFDCCRAVNGLAHQIKKGYWPSGISSVFKKRNKRSKQRMGEMQMRGQRANQMHHLHGHTLLELLITFPLGLAVTLAGVSLYRAQHAAFEQIAERSQLAEDGWAALHLIATHLRIAGFSSPLEIQHEDTNSLGLFGCTASRPAQGSICKTQKGERSDGIEVRYQADTASSWRSTRGNPTDCLGQEIKISERAENQAQVVNRFFARVSPSSGQPALYCEGNGQRNNSQPLVAGVERLYLRYRLGSTLNRVDAAAIAPNQWNQVTMVQLCVVMRGQRSTAYSTYVDCEGKRVTSADGLSRQALTTWVALRNKLNTRLNTQSSDSFSETVHDL